MSEQPEARILITVSGPDHPGITATLMGILALHRSTVLDMEQVVVQGRLNLSIVIEGDRVHSSGTLKDLLFAAKEHGNDLDFRILDGSAKVERRAQYVLTLLGVPQLEARAVASVAHVLAAHRFNIEKLEKLSDASFATLEMTIAHQAKGSAEGPIAAVRKELVERAADLGVDIAIQPEGFFRRAKRLVVFDLDSTLVQGETLDLVADSVGVQEQVATITRSAMRGEIDYETSLRQRVALLAGVRLETLQAVAREVELTPGAPELVGALRQLGFGTAIVSGGLTPVAEALGRRLGVDSVHANEPEIQAGALSGRVLDPVLDGAAKAQIVRSLARQQGVSLDQVVAVGDGANDLAMLEIAGLGIAFRAHAVVRDRAHHVLDRSRLDSILFLLGVSERHLRALSRDTPDASV